MNFLAGFEESGYNDANLSGPLVEGANGNFYGMTADAQNGYGTVFQLNLHGIVSMAAASYTVNENAGTVTLLVYRMSSTAGAIAVNYSTADGTAVAGTDYFSQVGTLSWADGDATSRTIVVPITDRFTGGSPARSFTVALTLTTGGAALGNPAAATVNIVESKPVPVVEVASSGDGKAQYGVEKGKVVFRRTGDLNAALTVFYKVKGTAEAGVDFKMLTGQLVIPAGSAQAKIKIKPLDDPGNTGKLKAKIVLLPPGDDSYSVGNSRLAKIVVLGTRG